MKNGVNYWFENRQKLFDEYSDNKSTYNILLEKFITGFEKILNRNNINGSVKGRVKNFEALLKKLLVKCQKEDIDDPLRTITDIIGIRIVVPFLSDVDLVERILEKKYKVTEIERKSRALSIREFGYDSTHLLIETRYRNINSNESTPVRTIKIEIQLRTTLQDAWAEVEHELIYKTSVEKVEDAIRRKLLALNATLSLADITFQEIREYHNKKYDELQIKHKRLLDKVSTIPEKAGNKIDRSNGYNDLYPETDEQNLDTGSRVNNMFIEAINAHINNNFKRAIELYTRLLAISPNNHLYNHRGLVFIATSEYNRAIEDFTRAIELEPNDIRVYTNRGLAYRMTHRYKEALADFNKSLELNPLWPDTLYGRSLTYYDMGDVKRALEDCEKAVSLKPDFKQASRFKQFLLNVGLG